MRNSIFTVSKCLLPNGLLVTKEKMMIVEKSGRPPP